jgi:multicomponent Na+:H+ antiporter subunit G
MTAWIADVLIVLGLIVMTLGVYGIVRFPDVYTQLHASSKAASLGVSILLVATALGAGLSMLARVALIVALLAITTPVAAQAIAKTFPITAPVATPIPAPKATLASAALGLDDAGWRSSLILATCLAED